jgi:hypothetical protein
MSHRIGRTAQAVLAATASLTLMAGADAAQAHPHGYAPAYGHYGPADPCARTAAERRLGWGIVGLVAGGLAGGAVAAAGVAAEGAALGAFVGAIIGGAAGASSAACGTAAYVAAPQEQVQYTEPYYVRNHYANVAYYAPRPYYPHRPDGFYAGAPCCAGPEHQQYFNEGPQQAPVGPPPGPPPQAAPAPQTMAPQGEAYGPPPAKAPRN